MAAALLDPVDVFVIGTASLDTLHLADGRTAHAAGGAGLYTALAAHRAGARTGLLAPKPSPIPDPLQLVAAQIDWNGPQVKPAQLSRLEIEHHGQGQATLQNASWGAEVQLVPALVPATAKAARFVHIAALSSAQRQLEFVRHFQSQPAFISVGTYARLIYGEPEPVRRLFELADLFFMNENEATGLFGRLSEARTRPRALLFVTLNAAGVLVIEGEQISHVPGYPATEVDPTGAGDTFCGATLAALAQGKSPLAAARQAVVLAAQTVQAIGPAALLD